jgi:hypothetical protein
MGAVASVAVAEVKTMASDEDMLPLMAITVLTRDILMSMPWLKDPGIKVIH